MNKLFLLVCLISLPIISAFSQVAEVRPLSDKILVVHFDEGFIEHAKPGEDLNNEIPNVTPLDINTAINTSSYALQSNDDSNYSISENPNTIYRKSKPTSIANLCEGWDYLPFFNVNGCVNSSIDHANEHWLYLSLPHALKRGASYTLSINPIIVSGISDISFVFDEKVNRSDAIHVNNVAYSTDAPAKYGYVYQWMGDGASMDLSSFDGNQFGLINTITGIEEFTGTLSFRKDAFTPETYRNDTDETPNQNFLGAEVYECDFSNFNSPGSYILYVDGIGSSYPFEISCNAFRKPFELVMKGLYNNRSGITLDNPTTEILRPAPHNPIITPGFSNKLKYTTTIICEVSDADASLADSTLWSDGIQGDLEAWGWYQDAGDWDAYQRHFSVPAQLLLSYEHFPENFIDGQLNIPESNNGLPDILDEARWLIRFYKRLKDETEQKNFTSGGVPGGRIFGDLWGEDLPNGLVEGSWQDNARTWVVSGEDEATTFYYAAVAANFQWLLDRDGLTDPENIDWKTEAINAYTWANSNYDPGASCHDLNQYWLKNYASASLYRLTGSTNYNNDFVNSWLDSGIDINNGLQVPESFGAYIYQGTSAFTKDPTTSAAVQSVIEITANFNLVDHIDNRSCRWGGNPYFPMIVGHATTPYIFEGIMAYALLKDINPNQADKYWENLHTTLDYFLGTNPLHMTWITGLGEKSPTGVFHLDSWASGDGSIKQGIVPYGPWKKETFSNAGPWMHDWASQWVYPPIDNWPGHERWFEQRSAPLTGEFTINQNSVNAAAAYGALSGKYNCSEVTGVPNIAVDSNCMKIFPNPSLDYFTIQGILPEYQIKVIDAAGALILNVPNLGSEATINLNNLGAGMYFVKIVNANNSALCIQKIIKM